jgi:hypothetical protein
VDDSTTALMCKNEPPSPSRPQQKPRPGITTKLRARLPLRQLRVDGDRRTHGHRGRWESQEDSCLDRLVLDSRLGARGVPVRCSLISQTHALMELEKETSPSDTDAESLDDHPT